MNVLWARKGYAQVVKASLYIPQGSQQQEVNFRTNFLENFRTLLSVSRGSRVKTQKMHVFQLSEMLIIEADQYCSPNKKAQLTQGLRATAPSFQDGRQPPFWIL